MLPRTVPGRSDGSSVWLFRQTPSHTLLLLATQAAADGSIVRCEVHSHIVLLVGR